jgi:hypothetical protein
MPATEHRSLHTMPDRMGRQRDASAVALDAALEFVEYIKFFRTHGTGELVRKYGEDECGAGFDMIVQRAFELAEHINQIDRRAQYRTANGRPLEVEAA